MFNKKQKLEFLEFLEINMGDISKACKKFNIGRKVIYTWRDNLPWFKEAMEDIQEGLRDMTESANYKNIKAGKQSSIIFYLKTKCKERGYDEKQVIEIDNKNKFNDIDLSKLSEKDLKQYIALHKKTQKIQE